MKKIGYSRPVSCTLHPARLRVRRGNLDTAVRRTAVSCTLHPATSQEPQKRAGRGRSQVRGQRLGLVHRNSVEAQIGVKGWRGLGSGTRNKVKVRVRIRRRVKVRVRGQG